ncbi:MAG: HupE/UreJ family protein [Gammaproteobacteria bacterium]|nr:HupE/UreJ family protein [Gammaproteobacteria bacterium]MBU1723441.1 HupE/UreJ family protein [Gammaproteobacteria bacterium]MBU2003766.1 HupE/UreJ family protein [Gammaproteobacteria bacterium]
MSIFFQQGFWHFLQAPAHIIVLLGLGLLLGQQAGRALRSGLAVFVLALLAGLLLTQVFTPGWKHDIVLLILAVSMGGLLAVRLELPLWVVGLLAAVAGILIGIDSAPSLIPGMKSMKTYAALAGSALSASLAVLLLALPALPLRKLLDGIILRVLGSWVVASALMVLALMFAPR